MNALYLLYGLMDVSVLSHHLIYCARGRRAARRGAESPRGRCAPRRMPRAARRRRRRRASRFSAPLLVLGGAALHRRCNRPARVRRSAAPNGVTRRPIEREPGLRLRATSRASDYSAFGPLGIVAVVVASAVAVVAYLRRRADARHLALACALPIFLVLISAVDRLDHRI